MQEKYKFKEAEAHAFADFLLPMMSWDPEKRASAQSLLKHPWLQMDSNYDTRLTAEEFEALKEKKAKKEKFINLTEKDFYEEELNIETSKLVPSDTEKNQGDDEMSSLSSSAPDFVDKIAEMLSSDTDGSDDSFTVIKKRTPKLTTIAAEKKRDLKRTIRKRE